MDAQTPTSAAAVPGKPRTLSCPECGGVITLRAAGHSVNVACTQCNSLLDVTREDANHAVRTLKKALQARKDLLIPLGARGELEGRPWEVVGYLERSAPAEPGYSWEEYLLYNPRYGFRFLTLDHGHWTLFRVIKSQSQMPPEHRFQRFYSGFARVDYVLGEFYWRVQTGAQVQVKDSIAPPYLYSVEQDRQELNRSLGRYLAREEVAAAFRLDPARLPAPQGIAPHQPSPYAARLLGVLKAGALALLAATAIQFAQVWSARKEVVHQEHLIAPARSETPLISPELNLSQPQANLCVRTQAALSNNWAELGLTLVNADSQERRTLNQGMEYYAGHSDGESWSEGDTKSEDCFQAVPAGRYRLHFDSDAGVYFWNSAAQQHYWVTLIRDAPIWSNWIALLLALLPYPLYLWLRHHSFEYARWSESEYMPEGYANIKQAMQGEDDE